MRAVLEARRKATAVRVEELEAELAGLQTDLVSAEEVLRRRVIGLEQYLEALAKEEAPAVVAAGASPWKPVGPRRAVPLRENGADVEDLSLDYQALMAAALDAGADGPETRRAAVVLGWDSASVSLCFWGRSPGGLGERQERQSGPMDSGLAALLGAAVGSASTLGAAIVNGRAQARSQHAHWSRQHRRDAYVGYLSALHHRDIAMDAVLDALRADQPDLPDIDEKIGRFITLAREVHRACELVILEGPAPVAEAAERITNASADLSHVMRRMAENAHAGNTARKAEDIALAAERERTLYRAVKDFRLAARNTIGNTN